MPPKPNLLFIFTDEQRCDTMGCYGNTRIETPNLNALAERSVAFENAYVTQPVCTPSRSSIMTGLWPHTCGCTRNSVPLRPETRTIAEMVSEQYICGYYGKWHLGDEVIPQHGFGRWVSIEDMYRPCYTRDDYLSVLSDYHGFLVENGFEPDVMLNGETVFARRTAARLPERFTKAAFLGREAAAFIRENRERPFVLYVNFLEPHMPFTGPLDGMYPPGELPVGPHFFRKPPANASLHHRIMAEHYTQRGFRDIDLSTEAGWRTIRARYWGLVSLVDRAVGEILGALDECGLGERTIVVFTSDHGDMMGDHAILAKCVMYEEALKVPLLVRVPWLGAAHGTIRDRVSQIDLLPTLLELLGEPIPRHLQGQSRASVLRGEGGLEGSDVFVEWNDSDGWPPQPPAGLPPEDCERAKGQPWRTFISADGWKLNLSAVDRCELYDLNSDPFETTNLFERPEHKGRARELAGRIRLWQERTADSVRL